jgi:hypothetical protein
MMKREGSKSPSTGSRNISSLCTDRAETTFQFPLGATYTDIPALTGLDPGFWCGLRLGEAAI